MLTSLASRRVRLTCVLTFLVSVAAIPSGAAARGGGDETRREVRVTGTCGNGATAKLKLKADDGSVEVEFEVDANRSGSLWRVTLVHERRVVARTTARTTGRSGSFTVRRRLRDLEGSDRVTARAVGPRGVTCQAAVTLPG